MARAIPSGMKWWPDDATDLTTEKVVEMYENGFCGVFSDPESVAESRELSVATGGYADFEEAAEANGYADDFAGKLVVPFTHVETMFPGSLPGPAQGRGDCVSHGGKNAELTTLVMDIINGSIDAKTGNREGKPEVPAEGIAQGVLSSEWKYWWRGYNGDGWQCHLAAAVSIKHGVAIRKAYPDLDIDLTRYSASLAGKYGSRQPPENLDAFFRINAIHTSAQVRSAEGLRDALGNGHGINTCGSEGYASTRDENGVSRRRGSWAHAMAVIGFDDRPIFKDRYGSPGVLVLNSWGSRWNSGPRKIMGTDIEIPQGSFWTPWNDFKNRQIIALAGVVGWARKDIPKIDTPFG